MLYVKLPEDVVDLINVDCPNEDSPSNTACTGQWLYWHNEVGTLQGGEWRVDASVNLVCKGITI